MGAEVGATTSTFGYDESMERYLRSTGRDDVAEGGEEEPDREHVQRAVVLSVDAVPLLEPTVGRAGRAWGRGTRDARVLGAV